MYRRTTLICAGVFACLLLLGCAEQMNASAPAGKDGWLKGSSWEKLDTVAKHLRGNDVVMIEVDWRFQQLAKTGLQGNWDNAKYQLKKMRLAMELGKERRPKRAASYEWFFSTAFPPLLEAIENKDRQQFFDRYPTFVQHCNTCHVMEQVPFFTVEIPSILKEEGAHAGAQ